MKLKRLLISALLALAVLAVFWPLKNCGFVNVNDFDYVTKNEHINTGFSWPNVVWVFHNQVAANWHPMTLLSHMLDCQLYGFADAGPHHLTSVLLHLGSVLLLFSILCRISPGQGTDTIWRAAFVAALFALHPLRVESVAWIAERKDVLSAFFFMLTLWTYVRYTEGQSRVLWYGLSLFFFALGLMSKPMLVTVPCVLLLLDFWPLARLRRIAFIEKIPFFLLTAALSIVTFLVQKQTGAMGSLEKLSLTARFANALISYARYLGKIVWPDSLAILYPMPERWAAWKIALAVSLFCAISLSAIFTMRRKPYFFMGWFWFVGMLVPVIGLVQVGTQSMADRYTYLPTIGLLIAIAWGLNDLLKKPIALAYIGAILTAACVVVTVQQIHYWKNTETLLLRSIQVTGKNPRVNATLGTTFANDGKFDQATIYLQRAIAEKPDFAEAYGDLAGIDARQGKMEEAEQAYETALHLKPALPLAHFGLASLLMKKGYLDQAASHLKSVTELKPDFAPAHYQLSALLTRSGDIAGAMVQLRETIRSKPDHALALNALAWDLATQREPKLRNGAEAVTFAQRAVGQSKNVDLGMFDTLAAAFAESGRFPEAIQTAQRAIEQANTAGQGALAEEISQHLKAYQSQQPWRE